MSQDFAGAFGLGNTDRKIHMVDANGVAVVAIQVLNRRLIKLQREVEGLSALLESRDASPPTGVSADVSASGQNGGVNDDTVNSSPGTDSGDHQEEAS